MKRIIMALSVLSFLAMAVLSVGCATDRATAHPSELEYKPLVYHPPRPADFRVELPSGMIVYLKEDHVLPTLDVRALVRTGSLYDPRDKVGLASMAGSVMRTGGTKNMTGEDLDERLAFLGGSISTSIGTTSGSASLSVLAKDTDEGLKLFADVLMNPVFSEDKIKLYKDQTLDAIKNRNDSPRGLLGREFNKLLYGDHPLVWEETQASIEGITRDHLLAFHGKYFAPNNIILCLAGDFQREEMLKKIEKAFAGWPMKEVAFPEIPDV